jgi:hypothetical protein
MNEHGRSGAQTGLVLLIPAALILAKAAMRHRATWGRSGAEPAKAPVGTDITRASAPVGGDRCPSVPRAEDQGMLDTWHTGPIRRPRRRSRWGLTGYVSPGDRSQTSYDHGPSRRHSA